MPRWHFFEIFCASVLCLFGLFVFLFGRMLAFFCVLSRSDETTTPPSRERTYREKREGGRILRAFFGRVILHLLFFLEEEL